MSNFSIKSLWLPALMLLLCGSCKTAKNSTAFSEADIKPAFFKKILGEGSVEMYRTYFTTRFVENRYALEYTLLNEQELDQAAGYVKVNGDSQDVYIFKIVNGDDMRFVYFSAKYKMLPCKSSRATDSSAPKCIGFGPSYMGEYDPDLRVINFNKLLKVEKNKEEYYLEKKNKGQRLIFVPDEAIPTRRQDAISITKVAFGQKNKIAGRRPVVYPVDSLFHINALDFAYIKSINF